MFSQIFLETNDPARLYKTKRSVRRLTDMISLVGIGRKLRASLRASPSHVRLEKMARAAGAFFPRRQHHLVGQAGSA